MIDDSAPIPISELDLVPDDTPDEPAIVSDWRRRLVPYRRHLFAVAIMVGVALGAALFFATHGDDPRQEAYPVQSIEAR